jgi:hypothetical protein
MTGKKHIELQPVDMTEGWQTPPGFPAGMQAKILSGNLDEERKTGSRTRLMRFQPGTCGAEPIVHEFWEEVYVVSGDFIAVDENGRDIQRYQPNTYTCRPPGVWHGPFKSESGCLLLEIHYFDPDEAR